MKAYRQVVDCWPNAAALPTADPEELATVIRPLGMVSRTSRVRELAAVVSQAGRVPPDREGLRRLPGVGEYVARAVRCFAFGKPEALVDGVSGRVLRRLFGLRDEGEPARDPAVWEAARSLVGRKHAREVNWAVLDLAAAVCKPRRPRCWQCPLVPCCAWGRDSYRETERPKRRTSGTSQ